MKKNKIEHLHSFIIDPFLLLGFGLLIAWVEKRFISRHFPNLKINLTPYLFAAVILGFWLIAGGFYLNMMDMPFIGEYGAGHHFMWNSGVELVGLPPFVDTTVPTYAECGNPLNLLAWAMFLIAYPFFLYCGLRMGRKIF